MCSGVSAWPDRSVIVAAGGVPDHKRHRVVADELGLRKIGDYDREDGRGSLRIAIANYQ
jgi:hypothetical protein